MNAKLRIIAKAVSIRLSKGENLDHIIESYPNLTPEEIRDLKEMLNV